MAHQLEFVDGVAQMAYAGETPWHGFGTRVPSDLSPAQMMKAAGLDWTVDRVPAFVEVDGERISTGKNALVRSSDHVVLDVVSKDWNPVQNHEAFEMFHEYCLAGDMEMHTAGSLRNGQMVWALAKVKDSFELFKGDVVESYFLFSNPHQQNRAIDIRFTPTRVVCNNTLTMALNAEAEVGTRRNHRSVFDPEAVKTQLGIATNHLAKYKEQAAFLGSKRYNDESIVEYFKRVFPIAGLSKERNEQTKELSRSAEEALTTIHTQPGASYAEGSWWSAFNAVTYMVDHTVGRSDATRMYSAWYGPNRLLKNRALSMATELAEVA